MQVPTIFVTELVGVKVLMHADVVNELIAPPCRAPNKKACRTFSGSERSVIKARASGKTTKLCAVGTYAVDASVF